MLGGSVGVMWSDFIGGNMFTDFFGFCKIAKKFVTFSLPPCVQDASS